MSDRYAAYAHIAAEQRQACWSHLIRDFIRISERPGQPGRIGASLLGSAYVLFRWRAAGKSVGGQYLVRIHAVCRVVRRTTDGGGGDSGAQ